MRTALVALLLLVAGASYAAQPQADRNSGQAGANQGGSPVRQVPTDQSSLNRVIDELEKTRVDQRDAYAEERNQRERRDIVAQEEIAKWAWPMLAAMATQTALALGALIALILDLRQGRKSAERQLRAYVRLDPMDGGIVLPDQVVRLPFNVVNYGSTPAIDTGFTAIAIVRSRDWKWTDEIFPEAGERPFITLHPTSPFMVEIETDFALSKPDYEAVKAGTMVVFAKGIVYYKDVFGCDRTTEIRVEFSGPDCCRTGKLRISSEGNTAT